MSIFNANEVATLVVRHRARQGSESAYEDWLRKTVNTAKGYEGHLGVDVFRSHQDGVHLFTSVLRFTCTEKLQAWLDSDDRRLLVAEVQDLLADGDQLEVSQGREFWFTPDTAQAPQPPRWKQACITFLVILPLSLIVPLCWGLLFARVPWLGGYVQSNVVITLTIVLLVVYVFMPPVTRLFAPWLSGDKGRERR
ncbi:antibiotic biosynthesis monooxygenase [Pseudomonas izuensis]|uniref:Antibiotic biosynthesis monooxygenase n=1 Tax=Pseudomonas izuensis TaxID=2684212 RepID=A0ABM7RVH3_9PSED|nr:antibiotic biosynthesis monooxygenase [Pseudomonas izuensis]BCX69019.1 antibiotic biosynthesis monooxygenase [Pseudomonas izuensis]